MIVDQGCDINTAASKCIMAKTINSGQTCIAPDYVLVHETLLKNFVTACKKKIDDYFPDKDKLSPFQGKMINKFHTARV